MANMFVERGRERQRIISANRERRNAERQDRNSMRAEAANTAYMDRMAQRAQRNGVSPMAAGAMAYGESRGDYADRRQGYMTQQAGRNLMAQQGEAGLIAARSPEAVARTQAGAAKYAAELGYMASLDANKTARHGQELTAATARYVAGSQYDLGLRQTDAGYAVRMARINAEKDAIKDARNQRMKEAAQAMKDGLVYAGDDKYIARPSFNVKQGDKTIPVVRNPDTGDYEYAVPPSEDDGYAGGRLNPLNWF